MYLLFDIGATTMRFAVSNGKKLEHVRMMPTPKTYPEAIDLFRKAAAGMPKGRIKAVVGGVPYFRPTGLSFWHTNPTVKDIARITKSKVIIVNDAALGGMGEAVYGAGKNHKIVGYLVFSTGHGGARITNRRIDDNYMGYEPRLQICDYNSKKKSFTDIQDHATGSGLLKKHKVLGETIKDPKVWAGVEEWMKIAVTNAAVYWSPEAMVLGGGVSAHKRISAERIQKFLDKRFAGMPNRPLVKKAVLGQLSGLYGALALANQQK